MLFFGLLCEVPYLKFLAEDEVEIASAHVFAAIDRIESIAPIDTH